jgi:hypothetical protein
VGTAVWSTGVSGSVDRGALWANVLRRLPRPEPHCGDYALVELRECAGIDVLARGMEVGASVVRRRLERGCPTFVACYPDGRVASWLWLSTGREWAPPLRQDLHFAPDECYGWDAGTVPQHRGRGLFTGLLRFAGWRMAQEGHRLMWGGILDANLASQRANVAAGTRPILRLTAIHDPEPTRLRVRRVDYADPELVLRARRILFAAPVDVRPGSHDQENQPPSAGPGRGRDVPVDSEQLLAAEVRRR